MAVSTFPLICLSRHGYLFLLLLSGWREHRKSLRSPFVSSTQCLRKLPADHKLFLALSFLRLISSSMPLLKLLFYSSSPAAALLQRLLFSSCCFHSAAALQLHLFSCFSSCNSVQLLLFSQLISFAPLSATLLSCSSVALLLLVRYIPYEPKDITYIV